MHLVIVNDITAEANQKNLTDVTAVPIFQDLEAVKAWDAMGGSKDDFYVYDSKGKLAHYLEYGGKVDTYLSSQAGYDAVKKLLLSTP